MEFVSSKGLPFTEAILTEDGAAEYDAYLAALADLKAKNVSKSYVLNEVVKLILENAADSPQKAVVQTLHDTFVNSPLSK